MIGTMTVCRTSGSITPHALDSELPENSEQFYGSLSLDLGRYEARVHFFGWMHNYFLHSRCLYSRFGSSPVTRAETKFSAKPIGLEGLSQYSAF